MRVIIISKTVQKGLIFGMILLWIAAIWRIGGSMERPVLTGAYSLRKSFPPLVCLPSNLKGPRISADAAVLVEMQSGAILYAKNAEQRRAPASTTKIMTAIVALEKGNLKQVIQVSRRAAGVRGSTLRLQPGDRLVLEELLEGMMLRSGNDGSMAVAEGIAGSNAAFIRLMNLKCKEIGALHTNFRNPHGLRAPSHYTTALDLALITRYALADPRFASLVKTKTAYLEWEKPSSKIAIANTNRLLWSMEGADGVKTGTTLEAGHCLVASATRDGRKFVAVVLNSANRWDDCARLLEYGFQNFRIMTIADMHQPVCRVKVENGVPLSITAYPRHDLVTVVEKKMESMITTKWVISFLRAPLSAGTVVGKIYYLYRGIPVTGVDLLCRQNVKVKRHWWCGFAGFYNFFMSITRL